MTNIFDYCNGFNLCYFFSLCVFISSPGRVSLIFQKKMKPKPVRIVSADVNLKRFPNKVLKGRRKLTLNMGEFKVSRHFIYLAWTYLTLVLFKLYILNNLRLQQNIFNIFKAKLLRYYKILQNTTNTTKYYKMAIESLITIELLTAIIHI